MGLFERGKAYGFAVQFQDENGPTMSHQEELNVWYNIQELLALACLKVAQSAQYDLRHLSDLGNRPRDFWWDDSICTACY